MSSRRPPAQHGQSDCAPASPKGRPEPCAFKVRRRTDGLIGHHPDRLSLFFCFVHSVRNNVNGGDRPWQRTSSPGCPALSSPGNGVSAPPQSRLLYCRIRAPVRRALSEVPPASPLNGPTARFMAHDRAVRSPPVGPDLRTNKGPTVAAESPLRTRGPRRLFQRIFDLLVGEERLRQGRGRGQGTSCAARDVSQLPQPRSARIALFGAGRVHAPSVTAA